jgi:hypothetical protein
MFFLSLLTSAQNAQDVLIVPNVGSLLASYDAALQALAQNVETQPVPVDLSAELTKQIEAASLEDCCSGLLSQIAEMQKQIEALNLLPPPIPTPITSGASILYGDSLGGFSNVTIGSGVSFTGGTLSASGSGGTITSISVASANGFAGTSSGGATPALTLTTSITGLLKGNGTAISAATSGTDYAPATSGTSILYGNGSGGFSNVTVGSGLSFSAGTLAATASSGSAPITKTADFTVGVGETWFINNKSGSTCTVTLPSAATYTGRELTFKNMQAQTLVSASSNVVPIDSTSAGTSILLAVVGNWATMVSDGTNWIVMQRAANNCLLLE